MLVWISSLVLLPQELILADVMIEAVGVMSNLNKNEFK